MARLASSRASWRNWPLVMNPTGDSHDHRNHLRTGHHLDRHRAGRAAAAAMNAANPTVGGGENLAPLASRPEHHEAMRRGDRLASRESAARAATSIAAGPITQSLLPSSKHSATNGKHRRARIVEQLVYSGAGVLLHTENHNQN